MIKQVMISAGEYHWLKRRRDGHTVEGWAAKTGRSADEVRDIEWDRTNHSLTELEASTAQLIQLTPGELCALARRRSGMKMEDVAKRTGVSRMTVWKQEHDMTATAKDLAKWWTVRRFPEAPTVDRYAVKVAAG